MSTIDLNSNGEAVIRSNDKNAKIIINRELVIKTWNQKAFCWTAPIDIVNAHGLLKITKSLKAEVSSVALKAILTRLKATERAIEASTSAEYSGEPLLVPRLAPGVKLWPAQQAGILWCESHKKGIIGDPPGGGKTLIFLSLVERAQAFPAICIVPDYAVLTWIDEINDNFPEATKTLVRGRKNVGIEHTDYIVCGYDILHHRLPDLLSLGHQAIVFDEADQYIRNGEVKYYCPQCKIKLPRKNAANCSNKKADGGPHHFKKENKEPIVKWTVQTTGAAHNLANATPEENSLRFIMTATPVNNRPVELLNPLDIVNVLELIVPDAWTYKKRYCSLYQDKMKHWISNGSSNEEELSMVLSATCRLARPQSKIIEKRLIPIVRKRRYNFSNIVPEYVDQYKEAYDDVIEFLGNRAIEIAEASGQDPRSAYWEKVIRAEAGKHLVRQTTLHNLAGRMKTMPWPDSKALPPSVQDIEHIMRDDPDSKQILFASQIDIIEYFAERYDGIILKIRAGVSNEKRHEAIKKFQTDKQYRILIANYESASANLTLTAAHYMSLLEINWNPAKIRQAIGRAFGRINDPHTITLDYHCLEGTVDMNKMSAVYNKDQIVSTINALPKGFIPDMEQENSLEIVAETDELIALTKAGLAKKKIFDI